VGLAGPNARRVSADAPWDFFWVRDEGKCGLVLRHQAPAIAQSSLPNLRGLEVLSRPVTGEHPAVVFRLQDSQQKDLFLQLCNDILAAADRAGTEHEAVNLAIARTWRWHHLLRGGSDRRLSPEEQKGLIGELIVLRDRLLPQLSTIDAVNAWVGPTGAPKDFEIGTLCIEAKARRGSATPYVAISSEHQLDPSGCTALYLHVSEVALEPLDGGAGHTLEEIVSAVVDQVTTASPMAGERLAQLIAAVGYRPEDDYSDSRWSTGVIRIFEVTGDFPRLAGTDMPAGVGSVRYSLALNECEPYRIEQELLKAAIGGACGN
jgi:hypothetical protein